MNIFELLWFTIFILGGALLGARVAGVAGMVVGLVAGGAALWLIDTFRRSPPK